MLYSPKFKHIYDIYILEIRQLSDLKPPESSNIITALKTDRLQTFIQATFDAS